MLFKGHPSTTASSVALRPVCHLSEFHTPYFPLVFIHLSITFPNSHLSLGNCSKPFVSLYVISPLPAPPVAAAFSASAEKRDQS